MKQNEYRAWMEGIREEYLIEAADYKPEKRAVPIWYTVGITSAVAAIAVCVGLIAYRGRPNITQPDPNGTTVVTTAPDAGNSPITTDNLHVITSAPRTQPSSADTNFFSGHGAIRVLSEPGTAGGVSASTIAMDDDYYYLPNSMNLRIPRSAIETAHNDTLRYETFTPQTDALGNLYDEYGYYTADGGLLRRITDDGSLEDIVNVRTLELPSDAEPDLTGKAKGIDTTCSFEKVFHINDHLMYIQYCETGSYMTENDIVIHYGCFYDTNTGKESFIFPSADSESSLSVPVSSSSFRVQKVYGKDAVFFSDGGSNGMVVDSDLHYYRIDLPENRKMNSYACAAGDNLYYASYDSDWYCLNYVTGEETVVKKIGESDPRISMGVHAVSGERFWFFGLDSKLYTMKNDFSDLRYVTDQFDPGFATMHAATDDTLFFSPSRRQGGAVIPGFYPLNTIKMDGSRFVINTFSNEQ